MSEDKRKILSVSQLTGEIKRVLENSFPRLWVQGEVSNLTVHSSGHLYFSLKDAGSQVRCVMFRSYAKDMMLMPQDGMQVVVQGDVTVFDRAGQYQLSVQQLQVAGYGELAQAFERLKKKLAEEGLFDQEFKKELPAFPRTIGIITSPTGAAIRDMIKVARRRWPGIDLILYPVPVQGIGAAEKIARAVDDFNEYNKIDLMIVGRGGGSAEDLWAFNDEVLARAIFRSNIPVISAVGHEVDFTISDLVADLRAPTPSAAAELAVPDGRQIRSNLAELAQRMTSSVRDMLDNAKARLTSTQRSYGMNRMQDMLTQKGQQLDWAGSALNKTMVQRTRSLSERLQGQVIALRALDPRNTLKRGYSICRGPDGRAIVSSKELDKSLPVTTEFYQGQAVMTIKETKP